jgi:hypothetical protein
MSEYYLLEFISMCWMGNHFHIVLYAPGEEELPDNASIAARHNAFYTPESGKFDLSHIIDPENEAACTAAKANMRDISHFMKVFQQRFTCYINKTHNRRGRLWADRFKSTILEGYDALFTAVKYVELNPVRAGITADPAEYRHCTWGWLSGSGKHLFASGFSKHLRRSIGDEVSKDWSEERLINEFRSEIARTIAYEQGQTPQEIDSAAAIAKKGETMPVKFLRRMRHISDGGIIGSKLFIRETASLFREQNYVMKKRLSHGKTAEGVDLYCFKQLRA